MNKEYWLIARKEGFGGDYRLIDRVIAKSIKEAKKSFERNSLKGYCEVIIAKSEVWLR